MASRENLRWLMPLVVSGAACTSILGIEDIHSGPKPGTSDGGETSTGGTSSGTGGSSGSTGKGGASGSAGKGGASGASGSAGKGGSGGDAGGGTSGEAGGGGTGGAPDDGTVHGRVVTHYLQPIPNMLVTIGTADAETNDDGEFEIPNVAPQYDASFVATFEGSAGRYMYAWVYQGLTRRDPTLMMYDGLTSRYGSIHVTFGNINFDEATRRMSIALGGPDGGYAHYDVTSVPEYNPSTYWMGPGTTTATAHGLLWEYANELPTAYKSYDSRLLAIGETGTTNVPFDLADEPGDIPAMNVSGTVTSPTTDSRENKVFLRFADGSALQLVNHGDATVMPNYNYLVPNVTNSSVTVAATEFGPTGFALAHRDNLAPGQSGVDITLPEPVVLISPTTGTLTPTTQFRWSSDASAFVYHIEDNDFFQGVYVITASKNITLPTLDGFTLNADQAHYWYVTTHGNPSSVDDMAGQYGFADAFARSYGDVPDTTAPPRDGTYTESLARDIMTPP